MNIINLGNRISNIYMVKLKKGYLLIDTAYTGQYESFRQKLKEKNIDVKDITYVFLTHAHDDHAGFLNEILDNSNAKIILHQEAVERLKTGQNPFLGGATSRLALLTCFVMKQLGKGEHQYPAVDRKERYIILDETTQPKIEQELDCTIINLPGHTADSIGLMLKDGSLFCGDAAMNGFPSLHRMIIWAEDLKGIKKSWETMIQYHPLTLFPAHGKPFLKDDLIKNIDKIAKVKIYPYR